jgi:hypothetical protein
MNPRIKEQTEAHIRKGGHSLIGVGADPSFTYSIGLSPQHGYELIMVGLHPASAGQIINDIAEAMKTAPLVLNTPDYRFANLPVVFKECTPARVRDYVIQADAFYNWDVKVVQVVMCDRKGNFPWDPYYDHAYMDPKQPLLYTP